MSPSSASDVHRGEIWIADLSPVIGSEMGKTRPVVVVSSDGVGVLPVRVVAPCTTSPLGEAPWRVPIPASALNGLDRDTTVDAVQLRSISVRRLVHRVGIVEAELMEDITAAIAIVVDCA